MTNLKNAFQGMADLNQRFFGWSADNIKAVFRDHAGITEEWLELIDMKIPFLTNLFSKTETEYIQIKKKPLRASK
ncbi:T7SS effector LXG polymorphic toxin [Bacillus velezensis]|uniref:T7SS effector LXG polymorphic toxin n=2 Tax=Bacillaceae TaxID=186817 RepID=UPI000C16063D|nr:T7SS effector LXG polymorphic toxin [Bacillus velezensis]QZY31548.1 hypothetical protein BAJP3144_13150 [Bacillus amyloliquefaciens]RAP07215.1 hypothetical protein HS9_01278 [Bacillus velezensis]